MEVGGATVIVQLYFLVGRSITSNADPQPESNNLTSVAFSAVASPNCICK